MGKDGMETILNIVITITEFVIVILISTEIVIFLMIAEIIFVFPIITLIKTQHSHDNSD